MKAVEIINGFKKCGKCKEDKPTSSFYKSNRHPCGFSVYCKDCDRLKQKKLIDKPKIHLIEKTCFTCKILKPIENFFSHPPSKDGKNPSCKECVTKKQKQAIMNSRRVVNEQTCTQCNLTKNITEFFKDINSRTGHKSYCKPCDNILKLNYNKNNKDKVNIRRRLYESNKIKTNLEYKIKSSLRKRLAALIKIHKNGSKHVKKVGSSVKDLGCSIQSFIEYIESLWLPGMSWENHGIGKNNQTWHIDHIIPLTAFDLNDPEQFKVAVHYTNLRPMWGSDNIRKGNKYV